MPTVHNQMSSRRGAPIEEPPPVIELTTASLDAYRHQDTPFEELVIRSTSLVRVHVAAPEPLRTAPGRDRLPLAWMPWQRQMMLPYLLPPELPESELMALRDFAVGFVQRNDSDLLATLQDMNATLHRDFAYVPGRPVLTVERAI